MIKKVLDAISLASLAAFLGVVLWSTIWGESPRAPGHLSIESKIAVWSGVPLIFGGCWLIVRYAKAASEKFPLVFGRPGHHGLLFYFVVIFGGGAVFVYWASRISGWLFR
jgi:hypothetical protein